MPPKDSATSESLPENAQDGSVEEMLTPIEAGAQAQAEHEFETERKIPRTCKTAIVSVNGEDVDEVPLPHREHHERAA
jgi:hypothetical protein